MHNANKHPGIMFLFGIEMFSKQYRGALQILDIRLKIYMFGKAEGKPLPSHIS